MRSSLFVDETARTATEEDADLYHFIAIHPLMALYINWMGCSLQPSLIMDLTPLTLYTVIFTVYHQLANKFFARKT